MITTKGNVKVLDFGLARLLEASDSNITESFESADGVLAFDNGLVETLTSRLTQLARYHQLQVVPASEVQGRYQSSGSTRTIWRHLGASAQR